MSTRPKPKSPQRQIVDLQSQVSRLERANLFLSEQLQERTTDLNFARGQIRTLDAEKAALQKSSDTRIAALSTHCDSLKWQIDRNLESYHRNLTQIRAEQQKAGKPE
jgi:chromosome segregation ATPase